MIRFLAGLFAGLLASGTAWALGATTYWICGAGLVLAFLIWFGDLILDDLL